MTENTPLPLPGSLDSDRHVNRLCADAQGARGAIGDVARLDWLACAELSIKEAIEATVADLRRAGESWADIGDALGISKQAAHKRYGGSPGRE